MTGTLVEISGQKLSTKLLRLERAWSFSKGWVSLSMAKRPPAELTMVAAITASFTWIDGKLPRVLPIRKGDF
ncbi:hypothetical protein TIFTF001_031570 [Ficus carica]|uniref:Uncharacterized protein n=1 Tax=Ficus carica TaxID=3494 RepID=A0AA88DWS5_FICCA|nr:hypothetical protein TIFTF001_031570 [Ficus carica]